MLFIEKEEESEEATKKEHTAEEIAKIMVENMKANMENPNFWKEKDDRQERATHEVIKKREERRKKKE